MFFDIFGVMRTEDLFAPPPDLPVPVDDGACDHLVGLDMPPVSLKATSGPDVRLDEPATRFTVVYGYPRTGVPGQDLPPGWNEIPGARGCTPQNCAFRDHHAGLRALGAAVYGLSTQTTDYQREMAERLHLPFPVLSDSRLELVEALRLPTFEAAGATLLKRFSMILRGKKIEHVIYPVFPSDSDAPRVVEWLGAHQ